MATKKIFSSACVKAVSFAITALLGVQLFTVGGVFADEAPADTVIYVDDDSKGQGDGSFGNPFATLTEARDAIRIMNETDSVPGGITVCIREGIYTQTETLTFDRALGDNGSAKHPITYKAYNGETAIIEGGVLLDNSSFFAPEDGDKLAARIKDETARAKVLTYDLSGINIDLTSKNLALFFGGKRAVEARYPNEEAANEGEPERYILGFVDQTPGHDGPQYECDSANKTYYDKSEVVKTWDPDSVVGVKVLGNFEIDWVSSEGTIKAYDRETNRVTLKTSNYMNAYSSRYYYSNIIEEMDAVGEYYIDQESKTLYFYAPDDYESMTIMFSSCQDSVIMANVDFYTFDGLTVEGGLNTNITMTGNDNTICNSVVRCAHNAVVMKGYSEDKQEELAEHNRVELSGYRNVIYNNEIYSTGGTAVEMCGGNMRKLISSDSVIDNNHIHDFGEVNRVYAGAIGLTGNGFRVSHNDIHTGPHTSFSCVASDMIFEYNHIHNVCYEAGDAGAIYVGGWSTNNCVYRYNLMSDIVNNLSPYYCPNGFYCDDGGAGKTFINNICINIDGQAIAFGGGRDNICTDNIIINSGMGYDQRGYYPGTGANAGWTLVTRFDVTDATGNLGLLWGDLLPHDTEAWGWVEKYPAYASRAWAYRFPWTMLPKTTNVVDLEDNYVSYAFGTTKVRNNVFCTRGTAMDISNNTERLGVFRDNYNYSSVSDIGFVDYEGGNYNIREDSKIYHDIPGFKTFNADLIGRLDVE